MKVFVTGATGYVGSRVVERLLTRGHQVVGLSRTEDGASRLVQGGAEAIVGDLSEAAKLADAARVADATLHLGFGHDVDFAQAVKADHDLHAAFADALTGSGKTLIVSNGTGGFGDTGPDVADETTPVDLTHPLAARNPAENLVTGAAENGLRGMAVRLPLLVYGHGGSVFLPMLMASARARGVSAYIGEGSNRMSVAHVDDVAELYALALERGRAGEVYIASAGEDVSFRQVAEAVAAGTGPECRVQSVSPEQAAEIWNPVWAFLLSLTNRVSGNKARRELEWRPQGEPTLLDDVAHGSYAPSRAAAV